MRSSLAARSPSLGRTTSRVAARQRLGIRGIARPPGDRHQADLRSSHAGQVGMIGQCPVVAAPRFLAAAHTVGRLSATVERARL